MDKLNTEELDDPRKLAVALGCEMVELANAIRELPGITGVPAALGPGRGHDPQADEGAGVSDADDTKLALLQAALGASVPLRVAELSERPLDELTARALELDEER